MDDPTQIFPPKAPAPGKLVVRSARPSEGSVLEALQMRASLVWEDYREQLIANPEAVALPLEHLAVTDVAELDGMIAGFIVVLPPVRPGEDAELDGLFVEPGLWARGLGRALVRAGEQRARTQGASGLHVIANPRALGFYSACDFEEVGVHETRFGVAPTLRKRL